METIILDRGEYILITKVDRIEKIGSYKNYNSAGIDDFNQFNIIYGENGSGKTIFSKLVSLYSAKEDDIIKDDIYNNLFANDSKLELTIDGNSMEVLKGNYPKEKIYVFNSIFVSNYLHDGTTANTKRFDTDGNSGTRIESPTIANLKKSNKDIEKKIGNEFNDGLLKKISDLDKAISKAESAVRDEWNSKDILAGKNLIKPENKFENTKRKISEIDKEIDKIIKELELVKGNDFHLDIDALQRSNKDKMVLDLKTIETLLNTELTNVAKDTIVARNQSKLVGKIIDKPIEWYESGLKLLENNNETHNPTCPLCNSNLDGIIEEIITDYQKYFDESLSELNKSLTSLSSSIETAENNIKNRAEGMLNHLVYKYTNVFLDETPDLSFEIIDEVQELLDSLKKDISEKKNDCSYIPIVDFEKLNKLMNHYNYLVDNFYLVKEKLNEYLSKRTNESEIELNLKSLFYEKFSALAVLNSDEREPINKIKNLWDQKNDFEKERQKNLDRIQTEVLKLQIESEKVNSYLQKFNITRFKVSIDDNLHIVYAEGEKKDSLKHSLSEGEKTTLAFAYFLSKLEHEVGKENYKDYIIFMDDPISSIDEDRLFFTASMIYEEFKEVKQLFISSHSFKFLRILNNFLKFFNKKKSNMLMNLYMIRYDEGSRIIPLPVEYSYFNTMYYSKLQLVTKYASGEPLSFEEIKSIPNSVRIVLESFLSFKFAYLRSKNNYGITPGLNSLFNCIKNEDDSYFENLVEVDGINKENWKEKIDWFMIHYTNMFSHGNPSAMEVHEPSSSEKELMKFCKTTIGLIKFLDGIHFKMVPKNIVEEF